MINAFILPVYNYYWKLDSQETVILPVAEYICKRARKSKSAKWLV